MASDHALSGLKACDRAGEPSVMMSNKEMDALNQIWGPLLSDSSGKVEYGSIFPYVLFVTKLSELRTA